MKATARFDVTCTWMTGLPADPCVVPVTARI
jgi:hypothetical protein